MEEDTSIVKYHKNINIDTEEYILEIKEDIKVGLSGVHQTHVIEIYLYNSDRSQYGLLSFSIYPDHIWINMVKCGIISLKGKCAKILFSIFYLYITSILHIDKTTPVQLIVQPDIDYKPIDEIMDAIRDIKQPIDKQTKMVELFKTKISDIYLEDKHEALHFLVHKYVTIPALKKLTKLYKSLGFKIDEYRMKTTVGELIVGQLIVDKEQNIPVATGGLSSKKSVLKKKLYKQKIYSKKYWKKRKEKKLLSKKIWCMKNKSQNMKTND
jgi:hypothetical protein